MNTANRGDSVARVLSTSPPRNAHFQAAAVFLVASLLLIPGLGIREIESRAEARIPIVALDIVQTGRVFPPYLLGEPYLNKPPLHHLLAAGAIGIFGSHDEFIIRLPSVLCGALAVAIVFLLVARLASPRTGLMAAAFLFLTYKFFTLARSAELEILLLAATTLAYAGLSSALWSVRGPAVPRTRAWSIAAAGVALASLAKGPAVALAFPAVLLVADAIVSRSPRRILSRGPLILILGAIAGTAIYYGPLVAQLGGIDALRSRLAFENVLHAKPFHYYFWQLPLGLLPAGVLVPWMLLRFRSSGAIERTAALSVAIGVLAFSISESKQSHYLLPFYPLVALWAAMTLRPLPRWTLPALIAACMAMPIVTVAYEHHQATRKTTPPSPATLLRSFAADVTGMPIATRERHPVVAWHLDRRDLEICDTIAAATRFLDERRGALVVDLEKGEALPAELTLYPRRAETANDGHTYMLLTGR